MLSPEARRKIAIMLAEKAKQQGVPRQVPGAAPMATPALPMPKVPPIPSITPVAPIKVPSAPQMAQVPTPQVPSFKMIRKKIGKF